MHRQFFGLERIFNALGFGGKNKKRKGIKPNKRRTFGPEPLEARSLLSIGGVSLTGVLGSSLAVTGNSRTEQFAPYTLQLSSAVALGNWQINWGDNATDSLAGTASTATHIYVGSPRRYTVTATALDDSNESGTATLSVLVLPGVPQLPAYQAGQDDTGMSGRWLNQDSQSQQETGDVTISGASSANQGSPYQLNLPTEDSNSNAITAWVISWGDGGQPQSISGEPASVTHDYGAIGHYAISATATVSDGQSGTYTAVTGGQAGAPDSSFGTSGIAQVNGDNYGTGNSVAIDPNGDLVVTPPGQLMFYTPDGSPDTRFSTVNTGLYSAWVCKTAVQPDGKVLVAGDVTVSDNGYYGYLDEIAVKRYNADGTLDTTFGTAGQTTTTFFGQDGEYDLPASLLLEPNGNIVVAGNACTTDAGYVGIVRLTSNGLPDNSLNGDGMATASLGVGVSSAALQPDGKIVVGGIYDSDCALVRFNTNGTLDTGFGSAGMVTTNLGGYFQTIMDVAVQSDGKIVAAANSQDNCFDLVRYNGDGSLDDGFGANGNGEVATSFASNAYSDAGAGKVAIEADDKIIVAGGAYNPDARCTDFVLARYTNEGLLDTSFGPDGSGIVLPNALTGPVSGMAIQPDGRIVATWASGMSGSGSVLARYTPGEIGQTVTVDDVPPTLTVVGNQTVNEGQALSLTNLGVFTDPGFGNSQSMSYSIDWGDDTTATNGEATIDMDGAPGIPTQGSFDGSHTYSLPGTYTVTATVSDDYGGTDTQTFGVTVNHVDPYLSIHGAGLANDGSAYTLYLSAVEHGAETISSWQVNWGDGEPGTPDIVTYTAAEVVAANGRVQHTYTGGSNHYTITATATDELGTYTTGGVTAGSLDPLFGVGGKVTTDLSPGVDTGNAVAVQADGKIVALVSTSQPGAALARYLTDGTLDPSFGNGGIAMLSLGVGGYASALAIQPDGRIVVTALSGGNFCTFRYLADGQLDSSFGVSGKVSTSLSGASGTPASVAIQEDGKIVVVGWLYNPSTGAALGSELIRYNPDGSLDTNFGTNGAGGGIVTTGSSSQLDYLVGLAIQSDGKIVAGGTAWDANGDFALARFNSDGSLDSGFGNGGIVTTDFAGGDDALYALAIQPDGQIVAAGYARIGFDGTYDFALARYNATDGSLDSSFGVGGKVTTQFEDVLQAISGVTIQSDGKIVAAASACGYFGVVRYNADGSLDTGFGDGGESTAVGCGSAASVALQSDGQIVALGNVVVTQGDTNDIAVARFNTDGSLDSSFATDGIATLGFPGGVNYAYSVATQADGKLVVTGYVDDANFTLVRYNSDGSLDASFGNDGEAILHFDDGWGAATSVAIEADGKIVVAGYAWTDSSYSTYYDFAVARFNADGSLDTGFGTDGVVTTDFNGGNDYAYGLAIQPDGKIVVAGYAADGSTGDDFALARYNTDGSLDTGFGSGGKVTTDFAGGNDHASSVVIQSDGKIVAAGYAADGSTHNDFALARYDANGSLDTAFGTGGKVTTDFAGGNDQASSVAIQPDGRIVAAGYATEPTTHDDFALARYNTDGSLDTGFGTGGKVTTDFAGGYDHASSVALQSDGKIVAAGYAWNGGNLSDFALARYNTDGSLDTPFGTGGKATTDFTMPYNCAYGIAIDAMGEITVVGGTGTAVTRRMTTRVTRSDFAVARYLPGEIDQTVTVKEPCLCVWDGGGNDNYWSNPANWSGDAAPVEGDGLKFAVPSQTTYNDLPAGTAFISLEFAASAVTITGNPLAVIDSVTVDSGADGSIIEAPLTICGTDYTVAAGTTAIDYDITGADTLRKLGGGTLKLDYANDFTGDTEIVAGTLLLNNSLALQNSTLDMTAGDTGVLDFGTLTAATFGGLSGSRPLALVNDSSAPVALSVGNNNASTTYSGVLSGTGGSLVKIGSGTLTIGNNNNTYSGGTRISGGAIQVSNQYALGSGPVENDSSLVFYYNDLLGILGTSLYTSITGTGSFTKTGTGHLSLYGSSTFSGTTRISSGYLVLCNSLALQDSTLDLNVNDAGGLNFGSLTAASIGGLMGSRPLSTQNAHSAAVALTIGNNNTDTAYSGVLSGTGSILKTGTGTLTLGNVNNTYSGGTRISNGAIQISAQNGLGTGSVEDDSSLVFSYSGTGTSFNTVVTGSGQFTKSGSGPLTLNGMNTYSGTTRINAGSLVLGTPLTLQHSTLDMTTGDTGTLDFGTQTAATLGGLSGSRAIALQNDLADAVALSVGNNNSSTTYSGALTGSGGLVKIGTGTLTVGNNNSTYSGGTTISGGAIQISNQYALGIGPVEDDSSLVFYYNDLLGVLGTTLYTSITGTGSFTKTGTGHLTIYGANQYHGTTTITAGTLVIGDPAGTAGQLGQGGIFDYGTLEFARGDSQTITSAITGSGGVMKLGAGTLTLSGANGYGGLTTVNGGELELGTAAQGPVVSGAGADIISGKIVFDYAAPSSLPATVVGLLTTSYGNSQGGQSHFAFGQIYSSGIPSGTSNLALGWNDDGVSKFTVALTVYGDTNLDGTVDLSDALAVLPNYGQTGAKSWSQGDFNYNGTVDSGDLGLMLASWPQLCVWQGAGTNGNWTTTANWVSSRVPAAGDTIVLVGTQNTTTNDDVSGSPQFALIDVLGDGFSIGGGPFGLSTGITIASANSDCVLGANVTLAGSTTFDVEGGRLNVSGVLGGAGGVHKTGTGTLVLSGGDAYVGTTAILAGTVQVNDGGALGAGAVDDETNLEINCASPLSLANPISGGGEITKVGSGTATLSGTSTFFGNATISNGDLSVTGVVPLCSVTVANGGTLSGTGIVGDVTVDSGTLSPGVGVVGVGTLTIHNLAFTTGSDFAASLADIAVGGSQIDVKGAVTLGSGTASPTLNIDNSLVTNKTTGLIRVLIRDEGEFAANGTFKNPLGSSLGEYSSISVGGVTYYITYHYNAATEQFDTGNDVALVSTYFSVPQMKFHDPGAEATRVTNDLKVGTQYQLSDNTSQQGSTWANGNPTFSYAIENTSPSGCVSVTTSGQVTFSAAGTCAILVTATETGYADQTLEIQLAATASGGTTSYVPDPITSANVANYVLVLYNADSTGGSTSNVISSTALAQYYQAYRPGMGNPNCYLGLTAGNESTPGTIAQIYNQITGLHLSAIPDTSVAPAGQTGSSYASQSICTAIEEYVENYIEAHPQIRYVLGLCGLPSRAGASSGDGGTSLLSAIYNDVVAYSETASGLQYPQYTGQDRFSRAEYGAPLIAWLDCGCDPDEVAGTAGTTGPYAATKAYIDKEIAAANAGGLQSDGITISGSAAGVGGNTFVLDDTCHGELPQGGGTYVGNQWLYYDSFMPSLNADLPGGDIVDHNTNPYGPVISQAANPTAYGCWGVHSGELDSGYTAAWPNDSNKQVTFTGNAGWWIGMSVESFNGEYGDYMGDPSKMFSATAFGGNSNGISAYANTPICFVGSTHEPFLGGNEGAAYFDSWAKGWSTLESAWAGSQESGPWLLAVTDVLLEP